MHIHNFYARFNDKDFSQEKKSIIENRLKKAGEPTSLSKEEVIKSINKISVKKASGPDNLSGFILKKCKNSLLDIMYKIMKMSVTILKIPLLWKTGEIIPVSKTTLAKVDNDLRPVTLTPIIFKCLERIMLPKLLYYVLPHIDPLQFAYLSNRNTEDALNYFTNCITAHIDKGKSYARCLFIDYSSAFNTIQPHIMLECLDEYNVPPALQLWILDFMSNRRQYVKTSHGISTVIEVNTGAPQGCVLSAFLFVIYTNALRKDSDCIKIIKYADDTVVIGLISNNDEQKYI